MYDPPASRAEVSELLGEADSSYVDQLVAARASIEEIAEALDDLSGRYPEQHHVPSSVRVAQIRHILEPLFGGGDPHTMPIRGEPAM